MNFWHKYRNDILLITSLLAVAGIAIGIVLGTRKKVNLIAKISVQNKVVETVNLSDKEDHDYYINGLKGILHVHTHDGAIAVLESNCPHQDCVRMGYVNESNRPIICAYNAVSIVIEGNGQANDVEIG